MHLTLDPQAQDILDAVAAAGEPHLSALGVDEARRRVRTALIPRGGPADRLEVEDVSVPTLTTMLRLRIYRPEPGCLPVALFLHGGGWTVNDIDTHDALCRRLAKRSGWALASLEYRRAPEHKHPAALEDSHWTYRWLLDNAALLDCDPGCVALIGESSGGTMVATLGMLLRDLGAPMPVHQVIAYPILDDCDRWPSYTERGDGYILDRKLIQWYLGHYLPATYSRTDPYLFPLAAPNLGDLPSTLLMTAEFDPLRDEGHAYREELIAAGVSVEHVHASDQMHGFLLLAGLVANAGLLVDKIADSLVQVRASMGTHRATGLSATDSNQPDVSSAMEMME
jgi:acetyl esterase